MIKIATCDLFCNECEIENCTFDYKTKGNLMKLSDIKTLKEVSDQHNILVITLKKRLKYKKFDMVEGIDYKSLGKRQATILSPSGVAKITRS